VWSGRSSAEFFQPTRRTPRRDLDATMRLRSRRSTAPLAGSRIAETRICGIPLSSSEACGIPLDQHALICYAEFRNNGPSQRNVARYL
jgi:hypothetical protein